jgi:aminomethyltransferase
MPVAKGGHEIGIVTSGTLSPTLKEGIALAYVDVAHAAVGTELEILVRGKPLAAKVVKLPFV